MKKLKMRLDDLRVESFSARSGPDAIRGTVRGHYVDSNFCNTPFCHAGSEGCFETLGCTFTADFDCMESANCP